VLHALRSPGRADGRLTELLSSADLTDPLLHAEALSLLRAHPAMDAARSDLRHWAGVARAEIAGLPDGPAHTAFEALCDYVVRRTG
jgi:heptaprenyl diphosphate synthase